MKTRLTCWSNTGHLSQVYTGLAMLCRRQEIDLEQEIVEPPPARTHADCPPHLVHARNWHCRIEAGGHSYYVDVHDDDDISMDALEWCDVYLKRGYNPRKPMSAKVRPLGLNYEVGADGIDSFEIARRLKLKGWLAATKYVLRRPISVRQVESAPTTHDPRVLFLCRTWEPEPDRVPEKNEERVQINDMRAECIRALRREFGGRCIAGFVRSDHALTHYPHAVVDDPHITKRHRYLRLMHSTPICVATMGLHRSNGWKLAEYVAGSRAIVCEELYHYVPEFLAGCNYLPFRNAAECVAAVGELMDSKSKRERMSEANRQYYLLRLRPDRLVGSALQAPARLAARERSGPAHPGAECMSNQSQRLP